MQPLPTLRPKLFVVAAHGAGAAATAFVVLLIYGLVFRPLDQQVHSDKARASELQQGLLDSLIVRREHLVLTRRLEDLKKRTESTRNRLPQSSAESRFLTTVTEAAGATGVDLRDYRRTDQRVVESRVEAAVTVRGSGRHAAICRFIDRLGRFPNAMVLTELRITSSNTPDNYPFEAAYTLYHGAPSNQAYANPAPALR